MCNCSLFTLLWNIIIIKGGLHFFTRNLSHVKQAHKEGKGTGQIDLPACFDQLPLGNAMRNTYFHTGELAFPPHSCQGANRILQNYKTTIIKGSRSTEDKIEASLDCARVLELFEDNFYLNKLGGQLEAYKMSCSKKNTPPRHQAGGALKYSSPYHDNIEEDEGRNDESYAKNHLTTKMDSLPLHKLLGHLVALGKRLLVLLLCTPSRHLLK
jgi:hypothetical protein